MKCYSFQYESSCPIPLERQYEVTSTDVKIVDLPYNLNSYFLKAGITAYIGRSLYGQNNIYRHGCT